MLNEEEMDALANLLSQLRPFKNSIYEQVFAQKLNSIYMDEIVLQTMSID